ncbi:MAG TPA: ROK family protein [Blastocatellia bacterium]|nr:ROK family protein [Blastocatellia bacterium]
MPLKVPTLRTKTPETKSLVIAVEFSQAQISAALVDDQARIVAERQAETPQRTTRAAIAAVAESILALAATKERGDSPISAIGIAVPGIVDPQTTRVSISNVNGSKAWTRVPLTDILAEILDESGHDIRTHVTEKRARAGHAVSGHPTMTIASKMAAVAAAESWHGAARGKNTVVYLSVGAEIEAGILADGRTFSGANGLAGSAAWLAVGQEFKHEYEASGCLSAEATITSLARRAVEESVGYDGSMLGGLIQSGAQLESATVMRAARGGDKLAVKVIHDTCHWLGRGIANLISILNPEAVIIGGELGSALKPFLDEIREEARRWAAPDAAKQCRILSATAGPKAGVIGAARLAWLKAGK